MNAREGGRGVLAALDIGGTKIEVALGTEQGEVLAQQRFATDLSAAPADILGRALETLERLTNEVGQGPAAALGVACPGPFLQPAGRFLDVPNMPTWTGFELLEWLNAALEIPVTTMNDANAGVVAETRWGAAQGANTAVFLTMSTGMGAGLWLGGRLFEGPAGFAGEVGHLRLAPDGPQGFGKSGSVEGYLSGPGMVQVAQAELTQQRQQGVSSSLDGLAITPEVLCQAASEGDSVACASVAYCAQRLGELCALLVDLLNPEVIVLGTIGSAHPELFIPGALEVVQEEALAMSREQVEIVPSALENRAALSALAVACHAQEGHV